MQSFEINAEPRTDVGKGASRRLRRAGRVPGILYGSGTDVTMVSFSHDDLVTRLDYEAFFSHILTVKVDGKSESVVLKDLQRHPYKRIIIHVDFQRVRENEALTMRVPLHFMNEEKCPGIKTEGGVISHVMTEVEVTCLPKDLPEYIEVDMSGMHLNDTIHLGELTLPEGVILTALEHEGDPDQPVVNVHMPRVETEETEEEAEAAEAEEAEEKGEKAEAEEKSGKEEDED
ncbi:MAG: 50S ribosomal protein L25/general stress protein Ctc [Gammaproteobacteria bacterium]